MYKPLLGNETNLNDVTQSALYHLIGALLFKIKKFKHCDHGFNTLVTNDMNDSNNNNLNFCSNII